METIKNEIIKIWSTEYFKSGQKWFWLYNYNYFRLLNEIEFRDVNRELLIEGKEIFAIGGTHPDGPEHYLLFDNSHLDNIYILPYGYKLQKSQAKKIAVTLNDLFNESDYAKCLIAYEDVNFWSWFDSAYNSYEITDVVPKGVLPNIDLRVYFRDSCSGIFLSDHKEINTKEFKAYFEKFGITDLNTDELFEYRPSPKDLVAFIEKINLQLGEEVFYFVSFIPSGFWGIGNFSLLTNENRTVMYKYGLLNH
jgi:hypothetical protein